MKAKSVLSVILVVGAGACSSATTGVGGDPPVVATKATPVSYPGGFPLTGAIAANAMDSSVWYEVSGMTPGQHYGLTAHTPNGVDKYATVAVDKELLGVGTANTLCTAYFRMSGDSDLCSFTAPASTVYIDVTSQVAFDFTIRILAP